MGRGLTALRGTEVLAGRRGAGADATRLLDVQGAALDDLTAQAFYGCIGHVRGDHLDEAEATRLARVGVLHDLALLDLAVLLEEAGDLRLLQARVDAGDEEVGAGVDRALVVLAAAVILDGSAVGELVAIASRRKAAGGYLLCARRTGRCRWETWSDGASRGHHRDAATHYGRGRSEDRHLVRGDS
jgi:hypothetical protein